LFLRIKSFWLIEFLNDESLDAGCEEPGAPLAASRQRLASS